MDLGIGNPRVQKIAADGVAARTVESWTNTTSEQVWRSETGTPGTVSMLASLAPTIPYTMRLPPAQGGSNTVLTNDGSGNLSWSSGGGGGSPFICTGTTILPAGVGLGTVLTLSLASADPLAGAHVDVRICGVRVGDEVVTFHTMGEASLAAGTLTFFPAFAAPTSPQWSAVTAGPTMAIFISLGASPIQLGWTLIVTPTPGTTFTCA